VPEQEEFTNSKAVVLDAFLRDWRLELTPGLAEHSWNPDWPESRMATNEKYGEQVVQGLVYQALWSLGHKIDRGISPSAVLQCTKTPAVAFYASRHRASELNRERKVGRGAGGGGESERGIQNKAADPNLKTI
jgi:hypothetical protein